ncbi:MAG: methyltransferase domain-containing protein [Phycisphaerae bacterium]|nr:methyltransferase domain-containing protein [Phycisphaerae bacterium]HON91964.1 methyltransferase domain-containing protein [Sedimentisphaerales bacterium]
MKITSTIRSIRSDLQRTAVFFLAASVLAAGCGSTATESVAVWTRESGGVAVPTQKNEGEDPPALVFVEFVRTPQDVVDRMLKMARLTPNDVVCDLGCGDGRILVTAARRYGCRAVGYDLDPLRIAETRENASRQRVSHLVTVAQKDVLSVDLEGVSVVTIYMGSEINTQLIPQLSRLRPGARIVSHDFGIGDIPPDKIETMISHEDNRRHRILLWRCPLAPTK